VLTHQLQVERRTAKARRPMTDVISLDHATNTSRIQVVDFGSHTAQDTWWSQVQHLHQRSISSSSSSSSSGHAYQSSSSKQYTLHSLHAGCGQLRLSVFEWVTAVRESIESSLDVADSRSMWQCWPRCCSTLSQSRHIPVCKSHWCIQHFILGVYI